MPLVVLSSPKGGVGKTTLTANLSAALSALGWRVVAIDFDVQNALRLHFGMPLEDTYGYVKTGIATRDWSKMLLRAENGVYVLPYGDVSHNEMVNFERALSGQGNFLGERLQAFLNRPDCLVIADTQPGPSAALGALEEIAALRVSVMLADGSSLALLPRIENGLFFTMPEEKSGPIRYIVNQVDKRRRLNRDVTDFVRSRVGDRLLGTVREDEAVAEAIADQCSVLEHAPHAAAADDIQSIARRIDEEVKASTRSGARSGAF